ASGSNDCTMRIWNVATGQAEQTFEDHLDRIESVAFSPGGNKVASGSIDRTVRIWNITTGQAERTLEGHSGEVASIPLWPDGSKSRSFYSIDSSRLWVTRNGLRILYLPFDFRPGCFAFKGSTLAIGTDTGRVAIITFRSDVSEEIV